MFSCWLLSPKDRPSFESLCCELEKALDDLPDPQDPDEILYVNMDESSMELGAVGGRDPLVMPTPFCLKGLDSVTTVEVHHHNRYVLCPQHESNRAPSDSMESLDMPVSSSTATLPLQPSCHSTPNHTPAPTPTVELLEDREGSRKVPWQWPLWPTSLVRTIFLFQPQNSIQLFATDWENLRPHMDTVCTDTRSRRHSREERTGIRFFCPLPSYLNQAQSTWMCHRRLNMLQARGWTVTETAAQSEKLVPRFLSNKYVTHLQLPPQKTTEFSSTGLSYKNISVSVKPALTLPDQTTTKHTQELQYSSDHQGGFIQSLKEGGAEERRSRGEEPQPPGLL